MPNEQINQIFQEIFSLQNPPFDGSRRQQILTALENTINGDTIRNFVVFNANLGDRKGNGALVYVLTNLRLIKFEIGANDIESFSPNLNTLINVERKVTPTVIQISIVFQSTSFGLTYPPDLQKITDFFQRVDQTRTGNVSPGANG